MGQLIAYQLKRGDVEAETECQARDGYLKLYDWVVKCPQCGSYTHLGCWKDNGNRCPRQGCEGAVMEVATPEESVIVITEDDLEDEPIITIGPEDLVEEPNIYIRPEDLLVSWLGAVERFQPGQEGQV